MKNAKKTKAEQIKKLIHAIQKFGDSDGTRKAKLARLQAS